MYDNDFETKEIKIETKDKFEPQHICIVYRCHIIAQLKITIKRVYQTSWQTFNAALSDFGDPIIMNNNRTERIVALL